MIKSMRDPVSSLTHLFAALAAAVGSAVLLVVGRGDLSKQISLLIYGLSLITMFSASGTYHLVKGRPGTIQALRKFDHSAIYFLIAGTYTPFCLNQFTGFWRYGLLAIVWTFAIVGVIVKLFVIHGPRWINASIYLIMGWLAVLPIGELLRVLPIGAMVWMAAGGLFFTLGAVIYITKKMDFFPGIFGFHEVWHIFVILGCLCHFVDILVYVAPLPRLF
jgi:hemolysin III